MVKLTSAKHIFEKSVYFYIIIIIIAIVVIIIIIIIDNTNKFDTYF